MTSEDRLYITRCKMFEKYLRDKTPVTKLCALFGISRTWFYRLRKRWQEQGEAGLRLPPYQPPDRVNNQTPLVLELKVLDYLQKYPTYGPQRVSNELPKPENGSLMIGHTAIYGIMKRHQLNTRAQRLEWVRKLNGEVVKLSDLQRDKELSKRRHIKADYPGALVGIDTFYVGCLKNVGRIYQVTACDCFSSFGWAQLYLDKSVDSTINFMEKNLLPLAGAVVLHRLLHDGGKEFTTHWEKGRHKFHEASQRHQLRRTQTKVKHPWTNGYVERLNQTILDEFYSVVFRKKIYLSLEELQSDLSQFMCEYNFKRTHEGYKLKEHGFKTPAEAFFSGISCLVLPEVA